MASRKGINISVHYVVSIHAMSDHTYTLNSKTLKGQTEPYFTSF